jgi:TetR/AcrR family transcriptional repressor of nem operon
MNKGQRTRERILEIAERSVLEKGFGATSIEEIIAEAGITKSGFFYHFRDKTEMARAMLQRYVETNDAIFTDVARRAEELSDDPLQRLLIGLKLLADVFADLPNGHPGCLIASVCYQERLFDREVRAIATQAVVDWNEYVLEKLEAVAEVYQPREPVDMDQLARMLSCIVDGAIIMSKMLADPTILPNQILMMRSYIKMLYQPAVAGRLSVAA